MDFLTYIFWFILAAAIASFVVRRVMDMFLDRTEQSAEPGVNWARPRAAPPSTGEGSHVESGAPTLQGLTLLEASARQGGGLRRALEEEGEEEGALLDTEHKAPGDLALGASLNPKRRNRAVVSLRRALRHRDTLRQTVLAQEVLGPPRGLQD